MCGSWLAKISIFCFGLVPVGLAIFIVSPPVAYAGGDANRSYCGSVETSAGFRTSLPDCRAYELVTPPYKEGSYLVGAPAAIASDGSHVIVGATGAFAGAENLWYNPNRNPDTTAYELVRTPSGWNPISLTPPATRYPTGTLMAVDAEDFSRTLWGLATTNLIFNESIYMRTDGAGIAAVGPGVAPEVANEAENVSSEELVFAGASTDLSNALFQIESSGLNTLAGHHGHSNLWPGDTTNSERLSLYEYTETNTQSGEPMLVGVNNDAPLKSNREAKLISKCGTVLGSRTSGSTYNAVSQNGSTVFFTADACEDGPAVNELYARTSTGVTIPISEPLPEDCPGCNISTELQNATFEGASQDGRRAFFLTSQALFPGQEGTNLYEYELETPTGGGHLEGKMSLLSQGSSNPEVQGVVRVSEDGSHVYFVAKGVLTGKNTEGLAPEQGADNLYVYESDTSNPGLPRIAFVGTLLNSSQESALKLEEHEERQTIITAVEKVYMATFEEAIAMGDNETEAEQLAKAAENERGRALRGTLGPAGTLAMDRSVWQIRDSRPAQATPGGRFLVFISSAHLVQGDESKVPQLFEYDANEETIARLSIGKGGTFRNNGNVNVLSQAPQLPVQQYAGTDLPTAASTGRAVSEDGSRVFFTSAAGLTPSAEPGLVSVYEYSDGEVNLISDGHDAFVTAPEPVVQLYGASRSGGDVFFSSADSLVPGRGGGGIALYDAREEGGFSAAPTVAECSGETCRGASGPTPVALAPSTMQGAVGEQIFLPQGKQVAAQGNATNRRKGTACKARPGTHRKRHVCRGPGKKTYNPRNLARMRAGR